MNHIDPKYFPLVIAAVSAVSIIVTAAIAIGIHLNTGRRMKQQMKQQRWFDACDKFRVAFTPILSEFRQGKADRMSIGSSVDSHEAAITEFRFHLHGKTRLAFDRDYEHYKECRTKCLSIARQSSPNPAMEG